jgi:hypothetical protein
MILSIGTISTIRNSLIIFLTTGHLCFQMVIYQLTTCYFANAMMKLSMSTISTMNNSLIIFSTTGHLCFRIVIFYQLTTCYLMKLSICTKSTMKNSLIILLSIGQLYFGMVILYQLTTCYFANLINEFKLGCQVDHKEFIGQTFDLWSSHFRMVILSTDHLLFCKCN